MNEKIIEEVLSNKILTYNDINDDEYQIFKKSVVNKKNLAFDSINMFILLKYISKSEKIIMSLEFKNDEIVFEETRFRFTNESYEIPQGLNRIMEYLISRDLEVDGVFKKSPPHTQIVSAIAEFQKCLEEGINLNEHLDKFSTLEIASVFKEALGCYKHAIFPYDFVSFLCRIQRTELSNFERIRAIRFLFFQLPRKRLNTLQSIIMFLKIIHKIVSQYQSKRMKQISFDGFTSVITPRLISNSAIKDTKDLVDLSKIMIFIANNFEKIITICEIY